MKNKLLISVMVPKLGANFDLYIPNNKLIGTIKEKILNDIINPEFNNYYSDIKKVLFIDRETGEEYSNSLLVKNSNIKNGSRIVIL